MFDREHYENLLKGLLHWRGFVLEQKPGFAPQLSGADLEGATLTYALLRNADLTGAFLDNANLNGAILGAANLRDASLENVVLKNANLENADLTSANLKEADLRNAQLERARLTNAHVHGAALQGASVQTVTLLPGEQPGERRFEHTDLSRVQGLTQKQINSMQGDSGTRLPDGLTRPSQWPDFPGLVNGELLDDKPTPKPFASRPLETAPSRPFRFSGHKFATENAKAPTTGNNAVPPLPNPQPDVQSAPSTDLNRFVFLSYKRDDHPWVQTLRKALIKEGISIWWDNDIEFDQNWDDEIDAQLERAEIVLTIWTDKSVASREVRNEALYAIRNSKLIQIQKGNPKLGPRYEAIQCADLTEWSPEHTHPDFDRLIDTLRRRLGE